MKREILINAAPRETRIAILEDGKLVELLVDRPDNRRMVGDIYLGRVDAVLPGIQAAFVDIGTEKSAFLHASDLVRQSADEAEDDDDDDDEEDEPEEPVEKKNGNAHHGNGRRAKAPPIQEGLKRGQEILVQISKEPISTKGPRVTAQISLAGRFLVYIPDSSKVGVSRKIGSSAERARLKEQVQAILPEKSGGVIVRTVSEDVTPEMLQRELNSLMAQWKKIKRKMHFQKAPSLVNRESGLTRGLVRDIFSDKGRQPHRRFEAGLQRDLRLPQGHCAGSDRSRAAARIPGAALRQLGDRIRDQGHLQAPLRPAFGRLSDRRAHRSARFDRRELRPVHGQKGSGEDGPAHEHGSGAGGCAPAQTPRRRRNHRLRFHRHGDEGES